MNVRTLSLSIGLTLALTATPAAHAVQGCGNAQLNGNFAMQFSGTSLPAVATGIGGVAVPSNLAVPPANATAVPVAGIAHFYLDGNGNLSGTSSLNLAGSWLQGAVSGAYTVNSDCTVSLTMTDSSGATENFSGVLVGNGQSFFVTQTDAGAGVSGTAKIQSGTCQTSNISGTFGFQTSGTIGATNEPSNSTGVISLDGQGNATLAEWRTSNGVSSQSVLSGSIAVNSDCSAVLSLTSQADGSAANYFGIVLFDQMRTPQFLLVQSDAGTAVTGVIVAQ